MLCEWSLSAASGLIHVGLGRGIKKLCTIAFQCYYFTDTAEK